MDDLFTTYRSTPRAPSLAPELHASLRSALRGVLGTAIVSALLGIPFSFVRFRSSRPWEPIDIALAGIAIGLFAVPIAAVIPWIFARYTRLFRDGKLVEATVVEQRPRGSLLQVAVDGPNLSYLPMVILPVGHRLPLIVGRGSLALAVVSANEIERVSLLTREQLGQLVIG